MKNEYSYNLNLKVQEIFVLVKDQLSIRDNDFAPEKLNKKAPLLIIVLNKLIIFISKPAKSKYFQNPQQRLKLIIYLGLFFSAILLPFIYFSLVSSSSLNSEVLSRQLITLLIYIPISIGSALLLGFIAMVISLIAYLIILIILLLVTFGLIYIYMFIYYKFMGGEKITISKDNTIEIISNKKNIRGEVIAIHEKKYFSFILIENKEYGIFTIPIRNKDIENNIELKDSLKFLDCDFVPQDF